MKILAIETSCDDTCVALLEIKNSKFKILSNVVSSQVKLHAKYGGVYPTLAKREHQRNLLLVLIQALKQSKLLKISKSKFPISKQILNLKFKILNSILEREPELLKRVLSFLKKYQPPKVDALAVTVGPGLEPCLWAGINFVKALACFWDLPIVPVNHIEAHILINFARENSKFQIPDSKNLFPAVCLIVSGGHTQLILMKGIGNYKILGETRDDAAGECFDKIARILGLGYPGGPAIAAEASKSQTTNAKLQIKLPRPMIYQNNYDFSFSGLKTAVLYKIKELKTINRKLKALFCYETQQAIIDVLTHKALKAAEKYQAKTIILGGGVAANEELRKQFKLKIENLKLKINLLLPEKNFCTDNAVMIAITAYFHYLKRKTKIWERIKAEANLKLQT